MVSHLNHFFVAVVVIVTLWAVVEHPHQTILAHKLHLVERRHIPDLSTASDYVVDDGPAIFICVISVAKAPEEIVLPT